MDLLIKNGHVIDPAQGIDEVLNVYLKDHKVRYIGKDSPDAEREIDAEGLYVFPGLIDFHSHVAYTGNEFSINPAYFIPHGITATVDAGTTGCLNYEAFLHSVIDHSPILIKTYINAFGGGIVSDDIVEQYNITHWERMEEILEKHRDNILGLKYRYIDGIGTYESFRDAIKFAHSHGVHMCVHTAAPCTELDRLLELMEKDDVFTHMYHHRGKDNILNADGTDVKGSVKAARERGVIFDLGNGNANFAFDVCIPAVKAGFWPDIIATDMTKLKINLHHCVKNLPNLMAKFLELGMPLPEIIRSVTETPARLMGLEGKIGTLKAGAKADVAIFRLAEKNFDVCDVNGEKLRCRKLFLPVMTVIDSDIAYCAGDFTL